MQLEYAALDAAVLIHIFRHVRGYTESAGDQDKRSKIEWKSHIVRISFSLFFSSFKTSIFVRLGVCLLCISTFYQ